MKTQDKDALIVLSIIIIGAFCLMYARTAPRQFADRITHQLKH